MITFLQVLMVLTTVFLILLVLVQRGRGGGLAGALGGMGGQSAFGTKAGDTFTRITIVAAAFWICLSAVFVIYAKQLVEKDASPTGLGAEPPAGFTAPPTGAPAPDPSRPGAAGDVNLDATTPAPSGDSAAASSEPSGSTPPAGDAPGVENP